MIRGLIFHDIIRKLENPMFQQTFEGWRTVYLIAAGVATAGATVFLVLGDTSIQEWNYPERKRPTKDQESAETC